MLSLDLMQGERMLAFIKPRPAHCDRGRFDANINVNIWQSDADQWPRYYFKLEYAKEEVLDYLKAKKVDITGAVWRELPDTTQ